MFNIRIPKWTEKNKSMPAGLKEKHEATQQKIEAAERILKMFDKRKIDIPVEIDRRRNGYSFDPI